ncbi:MAG: hypothetical protein NZM06_04810 [Chloroherpetonaceae bacterium]|nr:hypothetical protein [Chloroherpetonaceae bacterium]MDW8437842.1 hypothetical protein [Chloroherpetonaceae bacterium]
MIRFLILIALGYLFYLLIRFIARALSAPNQPTYIYRETKSDLRGGEVREADFKEVESKLRDGK